MEGWSVSDPTLRNRFAFPVSAETGATATSVVYFEVAPGRHCGRHIHSTAETMVILDGVAEVEIDGAPTGSFRCGLAHVPAFTPHNVHNAGKVTLTVVSVFASAAVVTTFEDQLAPMNQHIVIIGAPAPAMLPTG